jgi:cytochrome c
LRQQFVDGVASEQSKAKTKSAAMNARRRRAFIEETAGIPDGAKLLGAALLHVKEPARAANFEHGKLVYAQVCAVCHSANGFGQRAATGAGYQFPPLWGFRHL